MAIYATLKCLKNFERTIWILVIWNYSFQHVLSRFFNPFREQLMFILAQLINLPLHTLINMNQTK